MHKSITAKRWDNPRLAKQAVAKNICLALFIDPVISFSNDINKWTYSRLGQIVRNEEVETIIDIGITLLNAGNFQGPIL